MPLIVLASASPRRRDLLEQVGFRLRVRPVDVVERADERLAPDAWAAAVARAKALALPQDELRDAVAAVAADTVVHTADGQRLGKPVDHDDARRMLLTLSGKAHRVSTGVCLRGSDGRDVSFSVTTAVSFRPLSSGDIDSYLATDEPWDKAGAYAIQGLGAVFVTRVEGSYSNVVGLPLAETVAAIRENHWHRGLPWEGA